MNTWVKAAVRIVWLLQTYGVPKSEIDRKLTKFLLDLYKHKISRVSEKNLTWFIKTKSQQRLNQFPDMSQFTDPEPLESREGWGGFLGGAVVESLPANAGDTGSSPGPGRSHMPQSN